MSSNRKRTARTKSKGGTKLPYVQRHGRGFRGWYIENGRQRRGPVFPTELQAHRWAVQRREDAEHEANGQLTLSEGMELVRRSLKTKRRRDGTLRWYEGQFRVLERAWDPSIPLVKLDRRQVQWFVERRSQHIDPDTGERLTGSTIRAHLRALGRIFNLAIREGFISADANPVQRVDKPDVEDAEPYRPSREEVEGIIEAIREAGAHTDADLVQFLFTTGLRRTEFAHVRVGDVDLLGRALRVRHGKRRARVLPIPDGMVSLLDRLIAFGADSDSEVREWVGEGDERYLLPGGTEQRRASFVSRTFKRWKAKLKKPRLHAHAMRHAFITYLARQGFQEHVIAALSGHKLSASSITQHYVAVHGPDVQRAMGCFWNGDTNLNVVA